MNQQVKFSAPCCKNLPDILLLINSLYSVFSVRSVVSFYSRLNILLLINFYNSVFSVRSVVSFYSRLNYILLINLPFGNSQIFDLMPPKDHTDRQSQLFDAFSANQITAK